MRKMFESKLGHHTLYGQELMPDAAFLMIVTAYRNQLLYWVKMHALPAFGHLTHDIDFEMLKSARTVTPYGYYPVKGWRSFTKSSTQTKGKPTISKRWCHCLKMTQTKISCSAWPSTPATNRSCHCKKAIKNLIKLPHFILQSGKDELKKFFSIWMITKSALQSSFIQHPHESQETFLKCSVQELECPLWKQKSRGTRNSWFHNAFDIHSVQ